jgi:hypothetical protein
VTAVQLEKPLGLSQSYIRRKIREGMPADSIESAKAWLAKNAQRGKPGFRATPKTPAAAVYIGEAEPSTLEDAIAAQRASERAIAQAINNITAKLAETSPSDAVQRQTLSNQLSDLRKEQKLVVGALATAENKLVTLQKSRGQLVTLDESKALISRTLAPAIAFLKRIPQTGQTDEERTRLAQLVDAGLAEIYRSAQDFVADREAAECPAS